MKGNPARLLLILDLIAGMKTIVLIVILMLLRRDMKPKALPLSSDGTILDTIDLIAGTANSLKANITHDM